MTEYESQLLDMTADLVASRVSERFLARLFSANSGQWLSVLSLCHQIDDLEDRVKTLEGHTEGRLGRLDVVYLDYPQSLSGEGFCIIFFFMDTIGWSTHAVYNKRLFLRKAKAVI
ncbi:MAG: hypothetical protein LCI00_22830 [Chloroflexi bacterium]|nr:hypothetical protein [Chloroflexota bacterium]